MTQSSANESLLTVFFLLLAVAAVVVYFVMPENRNLFYILGGVALLIRIGQYVARFYAKMRFRREKRERLLRDVPPVTPKEEQAEV